MRMIQARGSVSQWLLTGCAREFNVDLLVYTAILIYER